MAWTRAARLRATVARHLCISCCHFFDHCCRLSTAFWARRGTDSFPRFGSLLPELVAVYFHCDLGGTMLALDESVRCIQCKGLNDVAWANSRGFAAAPVGNARISRRS